MSPMKLNIEQLFFGFEKKMVVPKRKAAAALEPFLLHLLGYVSFGEFS